MTCVNNTSGLTIAFCTKSLSFLDKILLLFTAGDDSLPPVDANVAVDSSSPPALATFVVVVVLIVDMAPVVDVDDGVNVVEIFSMARKGSDSPLWGVDGVTGSAADFADSADRKYEIN